MSHADQLNSHRPGHHIGGCIVVANSRLCGVAFVMNSRAHDPFDLSEASFYDALGPSLVEGACLIVAKAHYTENGEIGQHNPENWSCIGAHKVSVNEVKQRAE